MQILKSAAQIDSTLRRLARKHERYSWAVAWASVGFPAHGLLVQKGQRIHRLVVGTHFFQTHPDFIEQFNSHPRARFVLNTSGVFHPKVYLFESGREWAAIVGSANFTAGALSKNAEVAVLVSSEDDGAADALRALRGQIDEYWDTGRKLDANEVAGYRVMWEKRLDARRQLGDVVASGAQKGAPRGRSALEIPTLTMPWPEFVRRVRAERSPSILRGRLDVLAHARQQFAGGRHFSELSDVARKRIAGTTYESLREDGPDPDWVWFGSMRGAGTFKALVAENNADLSLALDAIPCDGPVSRGDYDEFVRHFRRAFAGRPGAPAGIGTGSRLLAMKRPDTFVCLDSKNEAGLRRAFGYRGTCRLDDYWGKIIEPVRQAAWFQVEPPAHAEEAEIWQGRVALLDALYYDA